MAVKFSPLNAGWILAIVYLVGVGGFVLPQTAGLMQQLIWVNLLFTLLVLLVFHKKWSREFLLAMVLIGVSGFLLEVVGVKTGLIFGYYQYGTVLGYALWDTPIMMMATWFTTVYITRQIAEMMAKDAFLVAVLASAMMVLLDYFIEPFAIRHGMWAWNSVDVPLHNYIGWFVAGLILQYIFIRSIKMPTNKLSLPVYLIQLAFFISLYLLGK